MNPKPQPAPTLKGRPVKKCTFNLPFIVAAAGRVAGSQRLHQRSAVWRANTGIGNVIVGGDMFIFGRARRSRPRQRPTRHQRLKLMLH